MFPVFLDTCVRIGRAGLVQAKWTQDILDEALGSLACKRSGVGEWPGQSMARLGALALHGACSVVAWPGAVLSATEDNVFVAGVKPSSTSRGRVWLSNFVPEDRPTAQTLLDSIKFVQLSTIRRNLRILLQALLSDQKIIEPAMVLAALSMEDLPQLEPPERPHVAFDTFGLGDRISVTPGSEGLIGNLIRDLLRVPPTASCSLLPPTATLESLRQHRCRSIVIVTDYSGSGAQLWNYAKTLVRNRTIRSWRSGGLLQIHAVAFAATPTAFEMPCRPRSPLDNLWAAETAPTFGDRPWTASERAAVEQLCHLYTQRGRQSEAFGYQASRGLFATEAGAPDNLPVILRQSGKNWRPFFDGRTVPAELVSELGDYAPEFDSDGLVASTGQARLARMPPSRNTRHVSTELLKVLALLNRRARPAAEVAATMGLDLQRAERLLAALTRLGLIDEDRRLTAAGAAELAAGKRAVREVAVTLKPSSDFYYPSTMR